MDNLFHTDKPVDSPQLDKFNRYEFSKRIASIISGPKIDKSIVVGIYGKWGEGKSSVMNFIRRELSDDAITINFNPWLFSSQENLLKSFLESIALGLGAAAKSKKEKIGNVLSDYAGTIGALTSFVGLPADDIQKTGEALKKRTIESLKSRIDDLIIQSGKNIVVFVDDIDRLDVDEIQYVFKLVKLVGDFPRTCYVLSFDEEIVAKALAPKYGGTLQNGYAFIEKIVQIPLKLPPAQKSLLRSHLFSLIKQIVDIYDQRLIDKELSNFPGDFDSLFLSTLENPRSNIRYANSLSFALPLLVNEVNLGDLFLIEGVKAFFPSLYDFIQDNSFLFLTNIASRSYNDYRGDKNLGDEIKKEINQHLITYPDRTQKKIRSLLEQIFPQLENTFHNKSYSEDSYRRWHIEKRICSAKHFDRYFTYVVQEGGVSDKYFSELLNALENNASDNIATKILHDASNIPLSEFILKLWIWREEYSDIQAKKLLSVLAQVGHIFPIEDDVWFATSYGQSTNLIASILKDLDLNERLAQLSKIISDTKDLTYAMEIYVAVKKKSADGETPILNDSQFAQIEWQLVEMFKKDFNGNNLFALLSEANLSRVLKWWAESKDKKNIKNYLETRLQKERHFALRLLKVFTPTVTSRSYDFKKMGKSHTYKSGFRQENYDEISKVLSPSKLYNKLSSEYGKLELLNGLSSISDRDPISDEDLIAAFRTFHIQSKAKA